jgi:hypothetical protein
MVWRWRPLAPISKIKSGKQNTVKRYTPFSALHQFFPTLPIICAQVAAKRFKRNTR